MQVSLVSFLEVERCVDDLRVVIDGTAPDCYRYWMMCG
jgi:hypothetical protein